MARRTRAQQRARKARIRKEVAGTRAALPTLDSSVEPEKKPVKLTKPVHVSESASYTKDTQEEYNSDEGIEGSFLVSDDSEAEPKFVGIPQRTESRYGARKGSKTRVKSSTAMTRGITDHGIGKRVWPAQGRVRDEAQTSKYQKQVNEERYGLKEDNDELMEQYHQWKIQGHQEDDFPKFKQELNPEPVREEFLPPQPRDISESPYEIRISREEMEEMKKNLAEAQFLLRRKPDQGITGSGLKESMAVSQDSKKKLRGEKLRGIRRKLRESSERDRQSSEEHQRVEEVKNIIRELKDIQAGIDLKALISDSVEDAIEDLIRRAKLVFRDLENIKEIDRLSGLMENYRYGDAPKLDLSIIKYLKFKDEFLDVTKVPVSERTGNLEVEYTDVSSKYELQDVRPSYEERKGKRDEKKADSGRQRARREREMMKEPSMMAMKIAEERDLSLEEERKLESILTGLNRKGLSLEDLGRRDIDQILELAAK